MNKYVEKFIERRKKEMQIEKEQKKLDVLETIWTGMTERVYSKEKKVTGEFPLFDPKKEKAYRLKYKDGIEEISDEDYEELLKFIPTDNKNTQIVKERISGWYTFAMILIAIGCLAGAVIIGESKSSDESVSGLLSILGSLIIASQIILLCQIEYNTRNK